MDGDYRLFLFVRIRIYGIMVDLQDWVDADALFYGYCLKASMTGRGKCGSEILDSSLCSE